MLLLYCITFYWKDLTVLDLVGVPETYSATKRQLSHQQIIHPPKSKLQVLHLILLEMIVNVLWKQKNTQDTHDCVSIFIFLFGVSNTVSMHLHAELVVNTSEVKSGAHENLKTLKLLMENNCY